MKGTTLCLALLLSAAGAARALAAPALPSDSTIRAELRHFVEVHRGAPGVVVGIVDSSGRRVIACGSSGRRERPGLDGSTRFEIGSITKTFTAALFAEMILKGEVAETTRVSALLPGGVHLTNGADSVTLLELATHTSGLPRLPLDWTVLSRVPSRNPYRGQTRDDLFRSLAGLPDFSIRPTGKFAYSNLGYALLGQLLARRAGESWGPLIATRVLEPSRVGSVAVAHEPAPSADLAQGHGEGGRPAPGWDFDGYAPAGSLIASADDMLGWLDAHLEGRIPALAEAMRPRFPLGEGRSIGLAWFHRTQGGHRVVWHNGGTGGFRSHVALLPDEGAGLVILANGVGNVDGLARRLLEPESPPLRRRRTKWSDFAYTLGLLLLAPTIVLFNGRAAAEARARPGSHYDRLDLVRSPLLPAIILQMAERSKAWLDLPFALWWVSAGLGVACMAWLLSHVRSLRWIDPGRRSAVGRVALLALEAGVLFLLVR